MKSTRQTELPLQWEIPFITEMRRAPKWNDETIDWDRVSGMDLANCERLTSRYLKENAGQIRREAAACRKFVQDKRDERLKARRSA